MGGEGGGEGGGGGAGGGGGGGSILRVPQILLFVVVLWEYQGS